MAEYIASTATFGCSDEEDSGSNDRTTIKAPEHGHTTLRDRTTDGRVEYIDTTNKIGDDGEDISIDLDEEDDEAAEA